MKTISVLLALAAMLPACTRRASPAPQESGESIFHLASEWRTEEGNTIRLKDLKGKTLVVVMIYTTCRASCPRLVADMLEQLKAFAVGKDMDGQEWTFLQGNDESVRELANVLAVKYKEISPMDFSHSNIISVFNPAGDLIHQMEGLGVNNKETLSAITQSAGHE
ncbi:SCO family protein [uncultured Chitinophaga sp.]|uniref:SCO family protein n=1 Tax=uncultured Chitinophaga sp. TaxID=339340 RepID=UPI002627EE01|nr:SCO family protein [uncultured Chitinophaga sp.]